MSVFKRYQGKRITSKHPKYPAARWWCYRRVKGHKTIHQALPEARTREQAEKAEHSLVEQLFNRRYGIADNSTTFGEFCDNVYKHYYEQRNTNIDAKRLDVELLKKHWEHRPLAAITPQDCRNVQAALRRRKKRNSKKADAPAISPSSVNRTMTTASKIFTLACQERKLENNPMQWVESLEEPEARKRILNAGQKKALWEELMKDTLLRRLVILAVMTPLRKGQILALADTDIDLDGRTARVIRSKNRPPRTVPLNRTAVAVLREICAERHGRLFPFADFRRRWHGCLIRAKINKKDGTRDDNFHFHDLRSEFATALRSQSQNPEWIQNLFAHSDMGITNIYMSSVPAELFDAVDSLDGTLPAEAATILQPTQETEGPPN